METHREERWAEQKLLKHKLGGSVRKIVDDYIAAVGLPDIPNLPDELNVIDVLGATAVDLFEDRARDFTDVTYQSTDGIIDQIIYKFNGDRFKSAFGITVEKNLLKNDNREAILNITT